MVQTRNSKQFAVENQDDSEVYRTEVIAPKRKVAEPIHHISEAEIRQLKELKKARRAAGLTNTHNSTAQHIRNSQQFIEEDEYEPIVYRTTHHEVKNLNRPTYTPRAYRETNEDRAIRVNKNSDAFFQGLKSFTFGLIGMGLLIIISIFAYSHIVNWYNTQVYGVWPTSHFDGTFGLPNEDKEHPTHVVAINDHGTFVIVVVAPYSKDVQRWTLPLYGFKTTDYAQLSEITLNGQKTLQININGNVWYMTSNGKELVPKTN